MYGLTRKTVLFSRPQGLFCELDGLTRKSFLNSSPQRLDYRIEASYELYGLTLLETTEAGLEDERL